MFDENLVRQMNSVAKTLSSLLEKNKKLEEEALRNKSELMSIEEVAQLLKVDKRFATRFVKGLPVFQAGSKVVRYYRADVEALIKKNTKNAK